MIIKKAEILNERGRGLVGKYLVGGAAGGATAALATSLINYYKTLKSEAAEEEDSSNDDDILYLNLRKNPTNAPKKVKGTQAAQRTKSSSVSGGLAITGGALAGMGSYAVVRKLYQKYKKKRLQDQLDSAQQGFFDIVSQEAAAEKRAGAADYIHPGGMAALSGGIGAIGGAGMGAAFGALPGGISQQAGAIGGGTLGALIAGLPTYLQAKAIKELIQESENKGLPVRLLQEEPAQEEPAQEEEKQAAEGKPMGGMEFATSMPVTLTLLAAIASGALTHKALEKTFPRAKKPSNAAPKKIVIRNQEEPSFYETVQEEEAENAIPKEASYDSRNEYDTYCDGLEFLVHMCLGREKVAHTSDLHNMVGAIIEGRKQEVVDNIMSLGFDPAMDLCKGAHLNIANAAPQDIALAVGTCVHTPELQSITSLLAASEYDDMAPHFSKVAAAQPENVKQVLCKIAGNLGAYGRACIFENAQITIKEAAAPPVDMEQLLEIIQMLQQQQHPEGDQHGMQQGAHLPGGSDENPEDQQTLLSTDSESSEEAMLQNNSAEPEEERNKPKVVNKKQVTVEADPKDEIDQMLAGSGGMG